MMDDDDDDDDRLPPNPNPNPKPTDPSWEVRGFQLVECLTHIPTHIIDNKMGIIMAKLRGGVGGGGRKWIESSHMLIEEHHIDKRVRVRGEEGERRRSQQLQQQITFVAIRSHGKHTIVPISATAATALTTTTTNYH